MIDGTVYNCVSTNKTVNESFGLLNDIELGDLIHVSSMTPAGQSFDIWLYTHVSWCDDSLPCENGECCTRMGNEVLAIVLDTDSNRDFLELELLAGGIRGWLVLENCIVTVVKSVKSEEM